MRHHARSFFSLVCTILLAGCTQTNPMGIGDDGGVDMALPSYAAHCSSGVLDGDETDVDCGGSCAPCIPGKACQKGTDCDSTFCTNRLCDAPTCKDLLKNGTETGVDCGGASCPGCAMGQPCNDSRDCQSLTCTNGKCAMTMCTDQIKDGMETDVDCGGGICAACAAGKVCSTGTDCQSTVCTNQVCVGPAGPTCMDNVQNGNETDIDCGGGGCATCADGKTCKANSDCAHNSCVNGVCTAAPDTCHNGMKDGAETDIDCGGGVCAKCGEGKSCKAQTDCSTPYCADNDSKCHKVFLWTDTSWKLFTDVWQAAPQVPPNWFDPGFNDAGWMSPAIQVGFLNKPQPGDYSGVQAPWLTDSPAQFVALSANPGNFSGYFRREFLAPKAKMTLSVLEDPSYELYLNGKQLGMGTGPLPNRADVFTFTPDLLPGQVNVLAIHINTCCGGGGMAVDLR